MQFYGSIQKLSLVTKKEQDILKDFVQLTILVPVSSMTSIAEFAKHYHNTSEFKLESIQRDLEDSA